MSDAPRYINQGASISSCGKYRYRLWREWRLHPKAAKWHWWVDGRGKPLLDGAGHPIGEPMHCVFIMLNPSTADGEQDDPTIRRCVALAKAWGYDRLEVINLFAYRATSPRELLALNHGDDPVGPRNRDAFDYVLYNGLRGHIICGWGAHGSYMGQDETALGWMGNLKPFALKITKDGHPGHPLYLPSDSKLVEFRP